MLRSVLWTMRQRRYVALCVLMLVVAIGCVVAGTWQISRFNESVRDNNALTANAHAAATPLTTSVVPIVGSAPTPGRTAIRFRTVTATGTYLAGAQQLVAGETLNGNTGFYVLTPFRTATGVLLVQRGFVTGQTPPAVIAEAPTGTVRITGRLQTASANSDSQGKLPQGEIGAINPAEQATRLGAPVYDAYLSFDRAQPGTAGLALVPKPDLSNPAGGAYEAQHFAYIVQWYLFALLALGAPFAIARHEVREARKRYLGLDPGEDQFDAAPALETGPALALEGGAGPDGVLAVRAGGDVAVPAGISPERWAKAERLADRYGRSLGTEAAPQGARQLFVGRNRKAPAVPPVADSSTVPHRSDDGYHGSYNDYLWQLALADGDMPALGVGGDPDEAAKADERKRPMMLRDLDDGTTRSGSDGDS